MRKIHCKYGKTRISIAAAVTSVFLFLSVFNPFYSRPLQAQETDSVKNTYDTALLPISAEDLEQKLIENSSDSVALFQLVRQADEQDQSEIALVVLKRLCSEKPNNAVVLASYCLSLDMASGNYKYHVDKPVRNTTNSEREDFRRFLRKAKEVDPDLWLIYIVEGHRLVDKYPTAEEGLKLLKKAVELNPKTSITHYLLGDAYTIKTTYYSSEKAKEELEKSLALEPINADARFALFQQYDHFAPNPVKAKEIAGAFVASLPIGTKVSQETRKRLEKYGVQINWK